MTARDPASDLHELHLVRIPVHDMTALSAFRKHRVARRVCEIGKYDRVSLRQSMFVGRVNTHDKLHD